MQESTRPPGTRLPERRVHRLRGHRVIVFIGAVLALGVVYQLAFGLVYDNLANVFVSLSQLPMVVFAFLLGWVHRVEVSPEGLVFHNMGVYTVRAGWDDVEQVTRVPFRAGFEVECILLRRSTSRGWTRLAWMLPKEDRALTIPLGTAWSTWSDADGLSRDILRRAPHVPG